MEFISKSTVDSVSAAAQALKEGHLVAFPTETVYGLGADATNEKAVSRIYSVKGRPTGHPLIVHISAINKLEQWAKDIPEYAVKLASEFWPGPMTLILPRTSLAKDFITGGQNNVGLRVPAQNIALALLKKFEDSGGRGIAAPSANRFGAVSPTNAEAVNDELSKYLNSDDMVLDGGQCLVGIESTIIDCTGLLPAVLRPGAITEKMIEIIINKKINPTNKKNPIRTSGMQQSHYSPKAEVILDVEAKEGEGFIALSNIPTPAGAFRLAAPNNVEEYSQQLYSALRHGDSLNLSIIKVKPATGVGLAESIKDRLERAAYKKT